MKEFIKKYKHGWIAISYLIFYLICFFSLEARTNVPMHTVHSRFDQYIPFNEYFYIPYFLWFIYISATVLFFCFVSKEDYYKTCAFLFIGMTICVIIYAIWPTQQLLRPTTFERDNFFVSCVKHLYAIDTPTNVCPSIHAYNSIGAHIAIRRSEFFKNKPVIRIASFILAFSICLSTMFLKQHSAFDVMMAVVLACVMYVLVYVIDYKKLFSSYREKKEAAI